MRKPPALVAVLVAVLAAVLAVSGCGADDDPGASSTPDVAVPSALQPGSTEPASPGSAPSTGAEAPTGATRDQIRSTVEDAEAYAVQLEQVFFDQGYPKDLAGARAVAQKLTNLSLAPGNTIASYVFDDSDQEFKLCVENTSGAWSVYDTSPMTTIESGATGGCR